MRVLFLAPQPFYEVRGTPLAVAALTRTLGELGHDIDLLTFPQGDAWSAPRVLHLRSARVSGGRIRPGFSMAKAMQDIPFAWRAVRGARSGAYDVVHAVEEAAFLVAPFLPRGVKFVVDMDSDLGEQLAQSKSVVARALAPFARWLHDRSLRRADLAIVINARLGVAGGMLVTGPGVEDFANPETGDLLRKYLAGKAGYDGEARTRAMNMVSDLTTGDFGGYHTVLAIHAEGSLEAEKLMISRAYDAKRTLEYAKRLAGLA